MTGIFGFYEFIPLPSPIDLLKKMSAEMQVQPSDICDLSSDPHISLGVISLSSLSRSERNMWDSKSGIRVLMLGEIFGYKEHIDRLRQCGYNIDDSNLTQFIASLYQEDGDDFALSLNGTFIIIIWDAQRQKLLITNDRMGFEPLYYSQTKERFAFASRIAGLLADHRLSREINLLAMAQFLTFDHALGNYTILQSVHLLPPASILTLVDEKITVRTYWDIKIPDSYPFQSEEKYLEEMLYLLRQAITRQLPSYPAGIMLSGGLDSRMILALLTESKLNIPLQAFIFGEPGCDDVRYARELAHELNITHDFYPLKPDYLIQHAEFGVRLTDGMGNIVHMHTLDNLTQQSEKAKIIYKGFLGDALAGYFSPRDTLVPMNKDALLKSLLKFYPIVFGTEEHSQLFSSTVQDELRGTVLDSAFGEFTVLGSNHLAIDHFFQYDLKQRQRRMTLNGVRLVRSRAIVRTPFYDNDLMDFMLRLPQGLRLDRYLLVQAFIHGFPQLAKIPYTGTGYPMVPCFRDLFMRLNVQTRWRLRALGLKQIKIPQQRHYANYTSWFRGPLRKWMEDILLSKKSLERGYFNPDYIYHLIREQINGVNHYQKLGALISLELWHRLFID